jgi:hypothetical protein
MPTTVNCQSCHHSSHNGSNNCLCISCSASSGIVNVDQGYYHNVATKTITNIPSLDLAYITNCENNNDIDVTINLNQTDLKWNEFSILFFRFPSGAFYINNSNANVAAISFNSQTYQSTQNTKISFSLYDQIVKAWAKKNNKPENSIPIPSRIQLERQSFLTKSLASINGYQLGLSLDETISTLLNNAQIVPGDEDDKATVKFNISYRDYFCPLDISLLVVFTFVTQIPCYKNVLNQGDVCPNYSNDCKPVRKHFDCDENLSLDSEIKGDDGEKTEYVLNDEFSLGVDNYSEIERILHGHNVGSSEDCDGWSK